jgi:hypothetical protein
MRAILFHINRIKEYMNNDLDRMFNVQVIENAKVHFIKLYKMNSYLDSFISKQVNCADKIQFFFKQMTKKIQQQRD